MGVRLPLGVCGGVPEALLVLVVLEVPLESRELEGSPVGVKVTLPVTLGQAELVSVGVGVALPPLTLGDKVLVMVGVVVGEAEEEELEDIVKEGEEEPEGEGLSLVHPTLGRQSRESSSSSGRRMPAGL